jgi:hypothetical protein
MTVGDADADCDAEGDVDAVAERNGVDVGVAARDVKRSLTFVQLRIAGMFRGPFDAQLLPLCADVSNSDVLIGGVSLTELAEQFGTPLFVYDEAELRTRAREAREAFDDGVAFASKSISAVRWPGWLTKRDSASTWQRRANSIWFFGPASRPIE